MSIECFVNQKSETELLVEKDVFKLFSDFTFQELTLSIRSRLLSFIF